MEKRCAFARVQILFLYSANRFDSDSFISVTDRINVCAQSYLSKINDNHGIKQKNVALMLIPIGVTQTYFDPAWLATLNSYGSKRGSYAHRSFFVKSPISRSDELNQLKLVLSGLRKLAISFKH